jgi:hypothetical protein
MNNDGTNRRRLMTVNHDSLMNLGWMERVAFTDKGIWWVCTDQNFSFKRLMFADRITGAYRMVADLSAYGDAVQGYWASDDGLHGMAWLHEETVALTFASHLATPTVRSMGIWGHGPLLTPHGDKVIINAMSVDWDLGSGNPDHKTWVVYDFATGTKGTFLDRFVSTAPNKTAIYGQWVVRNSNDNMIYQTDNDNNRYLLNIQTHAAEQLNIMNNGGKVMEAWMGALPNPHANAPAVGLSKSHLDFSAVSGNPASQSVTVTNLGTGTLASVTTSISPAAASNWLSVSGSGTGNTQTLQNTVTAGTLANGSYNATVTVNAANAVVSPAYTVTFTLGSQVAAATGLASSVAFNGADIHLSWQDNANSESGFIVQRSVNGGAFSEVARVAANVVTYTNAGLTAGTYQYRVVAYDANGQAAPSNTVSETLTGRPRFAITAPASGDTLHAGQQVTVRWSSETETLVEVLITTNDGESWTILNALGGISTADATNWGHFAITVPVTPTTTAGIRVQRYGEPSVSVEAMGLTILPVTGVTPPQPRSLPGAGAATAGVVLYGLDGRRLTAAAVTQRASAVVAIRTGRVQLLVR